MQVRLKNVIPLPSKLRKTWKGRDVYIFSTKNTLFVRPLERSSVTQIRGKLKNIGKKITSKEIESAIRAVRA